MPLSIDTDNPDSLQILLDKAYAVKNVNQESIDFITLHKDQKVKYDQRYSLKSKARNPPNITTEENVSSDRLFEFVDHTSIKKIIDIINSWKYTGKPLTREKYPRDYFIDLTLLNYYDVVRVHGEYIKLLDEYSDTLKDTPKSRAGVEGVLRNLEVLQVAIGEVHSEILEALNFQKFDDAMESLQTNITDCFKTLELQLPGIHFKLKAIISSKIIEVDTEKASTRNVGINQSERATGFGSSAGRFSNTNNFGNTTFGYYSGIGGLNSDTKASPFGSPGSF